MMEETGSKVIPMRSSLPEKCFSTLPSADKLIIIQKGEMGYIPSEMQIAGKTAREAADIANDTMGVTKKQEAAMLAVPCSAGKRPPPTRKTTTTMEIP